MAKKSTATKKRQAKAGQHPSRFVWGVALAFIVGFIFALYLLHHVTPTNKTKHKLSPLMDKSFTKKSAKKPEINYAFYESEQAAEQAQLAPVEHKQAIIVKTTKLNTDKPLVSSGAPVQKPQPVLNASTGTLSYMIQVESFSRYEDAEHARLELLPLGLNAGIKSAQVRGHTWYRVVIGPYHDLQTAKATQEKLKTAQKNSILIRA
jgi:cell division protein FtsN